MAVGDRGFGAAEPEARGSWRRARRVRPHPDGAELVDPRDRAAAGSDRDDVDHGADDGSAADLRLGRLEDPAAVDQRNVVRRAADVRADDVLVAELACEREAADDAAGRAGLERADRPLRRPLGGDDAAVRLHQCERALEACVMQPLSELAEILAHERLDVCVQDGSRGALELAPLRRHLVRRGDRERGMTLPDACRRQPLVPWVEVCVEEADRDRLDALGHEQVDLAVERVEVERHEHRPVACEPLRHFAAEIPRD